MKPPIAELKASANLDREGLRLVKAFVEIKDAGVRKQLIEAAERAVRDQNSKPA